MLNKKMINIIFLMFAVTLTVLLNQFFIYTYGLNFLEYLTYSQNITTSERHYLQDKKTIYFATDKNNPPFAFKDSTDNQYKGLVLDYLSALSIELETSIQFVPMVWEDALESVISGNSDVTELFRSESREQYLSFTDDIYTLKAIVVTLKGKNIDSIEDLSGRTIAVQSGDYANEYIINNIPNVKIINTDDAQYSIIALRSGKVDAMVGEEPVVIHFAGQLNMKDDINILSTPLYERDICLGVKKTDKELINILNKGILSLKKKDQLVKIQQKWFGLSAPILKGKVTNEIFITLSVVTVSLIIITFWSYMLNVEVKKRTNELNKSRNDLQLTFDAMTDYLVVVNEKGYVENVNKSFCDWLNETKEFVIGKYYKELPILDGVEVNLSEKIKRHIETNYKGRYYNFFTRPMEYEDNKVLMVIEDYTDQKISQQQMLQQDKMIAVGQLAAGLAHEIRNPLGIIRNYSYVLKNKINSDDELIGKSLNNIESSVLRAGKMVDNLLNFSRLGDDMLTVINLKEAINDIIALESKLMSKSNIELIIKCDENINFKTNIESLNHIILNLLSNAIDAVSEEEHGTIIIECKRDENFLYIDFEDNGKGIEKENLEQIFNPFFTTKSTGKGVGLGLYIVYNEVQKIGGEISIESQVGIGTIFKLKFPLMEEA